MAKLIIILDRIIYLYLYFVMGACLMSWIPNINPDDPLFHAIFTAAGFYIIPPIFGLGISPALVMLVCAFLSDGLRKLYNKFYAGNEKSKIIVVTPEELMEKLKTQQENYIKKEQEENKDDSV